jgi:hypothetical protein
MYLVRLHRGERDEECRLGDKMKRKADVIAEAALNANRVRRGQGEAVALTVRLPKADWMRLRQFAMIQGETLQTLAVKGFNRELIANGQPPLGGDEE